MHALRTATIAATIALLAAPAPSLAISKTDRKQNQQIAALVKSNRALVKSITALKRSNDALVKANADNQTGIGIIASSLGDFYSCLGTYNLTWYGNVQHTYTDGYAYTNTSGVSFFTDAMAPTAGGDEAAAVPFMVSLCGPATATLRVPAAGRLALPSLFATPLRIALPRTPIDR